MLKQAGLEKRVVEAFTPIRKTQPEKRGKTTSPPREGSRICSRELLLNFKVLPDVPVSYAQARRR